MHRRFLHRPRSLAAASGLPMLAIASLLTGCATGGGSADEARAPRPEEISGRLIAVLCDADMTWTAFADGGLGLRAGSARDALTVVSLPIAPPPDERASNWQTTVRQAPVSNSVYGPPVALAVSRDGRTAYACETRGPAPAGASRLDDLPQGAVVTAVNIADPANPVVLGTARVGREPTSCDVHSEGGFLAVATREPGATIAIVSIGPDGGLGEARAWPVLGADATARASCIAWHPGGRHLAVTLPDADRVAFFEFTPDKGDGTPGLAPWGEPVLVGKHPLTGRFTPDGRYFVTADVQWGPDVPGFMAAPPAGTITLVQLSSVESAITDEGAIDPARVTHRVVDRAGVGVSPESMAISPDGRYVVTGNLRGSFLLAGDPNATAGGSLSLVVIDSASGSLREAGEFPIKAMPEGVAFDASGRHVVVSEFRSFGGGSGGGGGGSGGGELSFYRLTGGSSPGLIRGDFFVGVGAGPHGVVIVR